MSYKSGIEWCNSTWNFSAGCSHSGSPGCDLCWAVPMTWRLAHNQCVNWQYRNPYDGLVRDHFPGSSTSLRLTWSGKVRVLEHRLDPAKYRDHPMHHIKPRLYFVCSMSDLFHPAVPAEVIVQAFEQMEAMRQHIFIICTKRPERIASVLYGEEGHFYLGGGDFLPNVWLLTSAENQETYDQRVSALLDLGGNGYAWPVKGVSCEPLLGEITDIRIPVGSMGDYPDWLIVGGESGPGARPMHPDWARSLRDECAQLRVPFFFKQWGAFEPVYGPNPDRHDLVLLFDGSPKMVRSRGGRLLDGAEHNAYPPIYYCWRKRAADLEQAARRKDQRGLAKIWEEIDVAAPLVRPHVRASDVTPAIRGITEFGYGNVDWDEIARHSRSSYPPGSYIETGES